MELRQLAYVVAVAEERSFTRAAQREHVAQPAVSAQVRRLEAELGVELFDRAPAGVSPTSAGEAVLPLARAALAAVAGVRTTVDELAGLVRGHVGIGVVSSAGPWLADALEAFHAGHPGVDVTLVEDRPDALLEGVRGGRFDFALVGLARATPRDLTTDLALEEELVAAVHPGHPLARRRSVGVRALAAHPLIALPRGTGGRTALEAAIARAGGTPPRIAYEAGDPRVLMDLARRGLGVAIVPASAPGAELRALPITPRTSSRLELVRRTDAAQSPAARALLERVMDVLAGHGLS